MVARWDNRANRGPGGAGYDIRSFDLAGVERWIEVKTTNGGSRTPFFLTRTEREVAEERPEIWRLYRVHLFSQIPQIWTRRSTRCSGCGRKRGASF